MIFFWENIGPSDLDHIHPTWSSKFAGKVGKFGPSWKNSANAAKSVTSFHLRKIRPYGTGLERIHPAFSCSPGFADSSRIRPPFWRSPGFADFAEYTESEDGDECRLRRCQGEPAYNQGFKKEAYLFTSEVNLFASVFIRFFLLLSTWENSILFASFS